MAVDIRNSNLHVVRLFPLNFKGESLAGASGWGFKTFLFRNNPVSFGYKRKGVENKKALPFAEVLFFIFILKEPEYPFPARFRIRWKNNIRKFPLQPGRRCNPANLFQ